ncbi:MAG: PKD domain-containing protein, partial [Minisyncoccales bacterium]
FNERLLAINTDNIYQDPETGETYTFVDVILTHLSAGSCRYEVTVKFKAIVDEKGVMDGYPSQSELELFDETGNPRYTNGYDLPDKITVDYTHSGPVTFGNINDWYLESYLTGFEVGDTINTIPVTCINILDSSSIDLRINLPCSQGEYFYHINFPQKYIGKVNYNGTAEDRNYSMLDIEKGIIEIDNIYIKYTTAQGPVVQTKIHELEESPGKISFDFQKIQLSDTDFSLPDEKENITYRFYIGSEEIIEENIMIGELPKIKEVSPLYTVSAYPASFDAEVSSEGSVVSYDWDFGDGNTLQTDYPNAEHIYNSTGTYELKLSINGIEGLIDEKKFNIKVGSAVNMTEQKIDSFQEKLETLKSDLNKLSGYDKRKLEELIDIDEKESEIKNLQREYSSAVTEKEYNTVAAKVQEFVLPDSITKTRESEELVFYPLEENINLGAVAEISSEENITDEQEYIDGLMEWIVENMNISVSFREYVISDKGEPIDSLKIFNIKTIEVNPMSTSPYLIIQKNDFELAENYGEFEEEGYIYIKLERSENEFEFSTQEDINFAEIPIFVSPELSRIPIGEDNVTEPTESKGKWTFFILIIIFLIITALVIYIVLQEWYKKKYEKYLFGSKNELYNLLVYIHNSKIKCLKDNEIEKKLNQAGWNSEQLRYAIRKYHGKRTGMIEIPIDKILRLFKKDDPRKKVIPGFNKNMPPIPKKGNLSHGPMNNMPPKKFTGFKKSIPGNFEKKNQGDFPKKDPFGFHKKTKNP